MALNNGDREKDEGVAAWPAIIQSALERQIETDSLRRRRAVRILDATHAEIDGRRLTNFSSNNYLGLTHHPRVIDAFSRAAQSHGVGSGAAALISGYSTVHASAERAIARWKKTESAILLASGYTANLAAVQTLAALGSETAGGVRFLLDKLAHASLIDAVRAVARPHGNITYRIFPHNHIAKLGRLLEEAPADQLQVVVTESVFSMDGDAADLGTLAELKKRHRFLLLLDEAHATGVYGPAGAGYAAERGFDSLADVSVLTLSKAIGVSGGAVCASNAFCQAVVNFGRAFIYSTNIPPAVAAAVEASIQVMHDEPHRQQRLRQIATAARQKLTAAGATLPEGEAAILPILVGDAAAALNAAKELENAGYLVLAIRPPTVPPGTSRLRLTLSSEHTDEEIAGVVAAIEKITSTRPV